MSEREVYCEKLIQDAQHWDLLFNNKAKELLLKTKGWIEENVKYCEIIMDGIKMKMIADNEKITYFSQKVIEGYTVASEIEKLADIKSFDKKRNCQFEFIHIYKNIGNLDKRWFLKYDDSHPDHIFSEIGRVISRGEKQHILDTIKSVDSIEIITLNEIYSAAIFDKIKDVCVQMRNSGFNPSVVFMPLKFTKNIEVDHLGTFSKLKIDENWSLKILNSNKFWKFDEIIILDKSAGIWTYKPIENNEGRVSVEITPNKEDDLTMKISVKTSVNYSIVKPDGVKIIIFDLNVVP